MAITCFPNIATADSSGTDQDTTLAHLGTKIPGGNRVHDERVRGCIPRLATQCLKGYAFPLLLADCTAEPIGTGFSRSNHDASLLLVEQVFWVGLSASDALVASLEQTAIARMEMQHLS